MTESRGIAPGSYVWNPSLAPEGTLSMEVDLASQKAYVYRDGTLIGIASIASGRRGYETPDGTFFVLEKERFHRSNKYDDAPMPYMQRLSWSGLALHGGHPHGHPASHGCIRMPMGFAAALFKEDTRGMKVVITGWPTARRQLLVRRQVPREPIESDEVRAAEFPGSENQLSTPPEVRCCEEPADESANGPVGEDVYRAPDQRQEEDRNRDVYPNENLPPPDLPPPPN